MAENTNALITLGGLQTFYNALCTKFMNTATADGKYAKLNGDVTQPFNTKVVTLNESDTQAIFSIMKTTIPNNPTYIMITCDGNITRIPLTGGDLVDSVQLDGKADRKVLVDTNGTNYNFTVNPMPCVFNQYANGNTVGLSLRFTAAVGELIYYIAPTSSSISTAPFGASTGLYLVTDTSIAPGTNMAIVSETEFIGAVMPFTLYYCIGTDRFYYRDMNTGLLNEISKETTTTVLPDTDTTYDIATDTDISGIITQ